MTQRQKEKNSKKRKNKKEKRKIEVFRVDRGEYKISNRK